jgi:hypothetical protein
MLSIRFAFSLLSSALVSSTLSMTVPRQLVLENGLPHRDFLDWSTWKITPELPTIPLNWFMKKSPAPLGNEVILDFPQNPGTTVDGASGSLAAPPENLYSYVYEKEEFAGSTLGTDLTDNIEDYENFAYPQPDNDTWGFENPQAEAVKETTSPSVGKSALIDGALMTLEDSATELSVLFRNISVQISHLRKAF